MLPWVEEGVVGGRWRLPEMAGGGGGGRRWWRRSPEVEVEEEVAGMEEEVTGG